MNDRTTKFISFFVVDLLLLMLILFGLTPQKIYNSKYDDYDSKQLSELIYDGTKINQQFVSRYNSDKFSLHIGTYRHFYKKGKIFVYINDITNQEKTKKTIKCSSLDDRSESIINYSLKKNHKYEIVIKTKGVSRDTAFIIYSAKYLNNNNYSLIIDEDKKDYNFVIGYITYSYTKSDYWLLLLYLSLNISVFYLFAKSRCNNEK